MLNVNFTPPFDGHVCLSTVKELQICALSEHCSSLIPNLQVLPIPLAYHSFSLFQYISSLNVRFYCSYALHYCCPCSGCSRQGIALPSSSDRCNLTHRRITSRMHGLDTWFVWYCCHECHHRFRTSEEASFLYIRADHAPLSTEAQLTMRRGQPQALPVSQIADGQSQAKTRITTRTLVSRVSDAQSQALAATDPAAAASNSSRTRLVACKSEGTLELTLSDGVLKDAQGRTGYIASNFQFQFDAPPQAGAIYTSGFSICSNGSLALGGSNIFYQCLSGNFYNLYDRYWAAQCSPVTIQTLTLQDCA